MEIKNFFSGGIKRFPTDCCALGQLSVGNTASKSQINAAVEQIKKESEQDWWGKSKEGGDRAIFVITTPDEEELANNLYELGFKQVAHFPRRNGYKPGMLKMWIISW